MSVPVSNQPPSRFTAGDTLLFSVSGCQFPANMWTLDYVLSRSGKSLATVRASASGGDYAVSVSASTSNVLPGVANWCFVFTEIATGQRLVGGQGVVSIEANPAADLPQTPTQALLVACNAALLKLAQTGNHKVDFQGQMFERQRIGDLMRIRDRLQNQVNAELRSMGIQAPGGAIRIQNRF